MDAPERENDAGEQWRSDLPADWEACLSDPPLATTAGERIDVVEQGEATVFRVDGSATCWIQARSGSVRSPDEYR